MRVWGICVYGVSVYGVFVYGVYMCIVYICVWFMCVYVVCVCGVLSVLCVRVSIQGDNIRECCLSDPLQNTKTVDTERVNFV